MYLLSIDDIGSGSTAQLVKMDDKQSRRLARYAYLARSKEGCGTAPCIKVSDGLEEGCSCQSSVITPQCSCGSHEILCVVSSCLFPSCTICRRRFTLQPCIYIVKHSSREVYSLVRSHVCMLTTNRRILYHIFSLGAQQQRDILSGPVGPLRGISISRRVRQECT